MEEVGRVTLSRRISDAAERCEDVANIQGFVLVEGEEVVVRIRGKANMVIRCRFVCYNRVYGSMLLDCEDGTYFVRVSNVVYMVKPKRAGQKAQ